MGRDTIESIVNEILSINIGDKFVQIKDAAKAPLAINGIFFVSSRHVESVVLLSQQKPDDHICINLSLDELDLTSSEAEADSVNLL